MGKHSGSTDREGVVIGTVIPVNMFNLDEAHSALAKFDLEASAVNHLAVTRTVSEALGHASYTWERIAGDKNLFFTIENAQTVDIDRAVGLLQMLHRSGVLKSFYVTTIVDSKVMQYSR